MTPTEDLKITTQDDLTATAAKSGKFNFLAEVTALEQTEAVIAGIEELQLEIQPRNFPTANLQRKISELREVLMHNSAEPERVKQAEIRLRQELGLWRMALAKRDDEFSAFDLRSFCESTEPPIDNEFFAALGKFYRNMPPTAPVLSKFDYVITQYFSRKRDKNKRTLRLEADKIVLELRQLNHQWTDGASSVSPFSQGEIRESITALAQLSANAKAHTTLKSWLDNEFFNYTRAVKRRLVDTFFIPEVTTAVVVCNLVIGNQFAALCEADSDKLSETAAMFATDEFAHQSIANQLNQGFQTLLYFSLEESSAETVAEQQLANLVSLRYAEEADCNIPAAVVNEVAENGDVNGQAAQIVSEQKVSTEESVNDSIPEPTLSASENQPETSDSSDEILEAEFITAIPGQFAVQGEDEPANVPELEAVLGTIAQHKPDVQLIKDYLQKSAVHEIRTLNLFVFLPELGDVVGRTDDKTLRRALGIIVRAQDLTQFIEKGEGEINADLLDEVNLLRDEIQEVNQLLRVSMRGMAGTSGEKERGNFENLLYATNTLVETQLRLNTVIVRRQPKAKEAVIVNELSALKYEKVKIDAPLFQTTTAVSKPQRVNPFLLVFATLVVLFAGGLFFLNFSESKPSSSAGNFKSIELNQIKAEDFLAGAKVNKETLYAFSGKGWETLNANQKKEKLHSIMEQGRELGFIKVIVVNKEGQVIATAWEGEINLS